MAGQRKKNDDALAMALAAGDSIAAAAAKAGMGERTAYRRLDDPAFRRRVQTLQAEMVKTAVGRLAAGMTDAIDVLHASLKANSEAVRVKAARTILDLGIKLRGTVLDEKVNELEKNFEEFRKRYESKPH